MDIKILFADDNEFTTMEVARKLKSEGFEVFTALNGPEAIQVFQQQTPDICFIDLLIPGKNGEEILKEIRRQSSTTKIVLMSHFLGYKNILDDEILFNIFTLSLKEKGADQFLVKPITPAVISQRVREFFNIPILPNESGNAVKNFATGAYAQSQAEHLEAKKHLTNQSANGDTPEELSPQKKEAINRAFSHGAWAK